MLKKHPGQEKGEDQATGWPGGVVDNNCRCLAKGVKRPLSVACKPRRCMPMECQAVKVGLLSSLLLAA